MYSEEHGMLSNRTYSEGTASSDRDEEIVKWKNCDRTTPSRTNRSRRLQLSADTIRRQKKFASYAAQYYATRRRITKNNPCTLNNEVRKPFVTGMEPRTKFMRDPNRLDALRKLRLSAGDVNSEQTREDTRSVNQWRQKILKATLPKQQPHRKGDAKQMTAEVRSHLTRKAASPTRGKTKLEASGGGITESLKLNEVSIRPILEQTRCSNDSSISGNLRQGIIRASPRINPPNSSRSDKTGSRPTSLHTTPRMKRSLQGQKDHSDSPLHSAIVESLSLQTGNSLSLSETLEKQRTSAPPHVKLSSSSTQNGSLQKNNHLTSSGNTLACSSPRDSVTKSPRNKTTSMAKREPMTFTAQFVPLLRWTSKTNSGCLFEPRSHEGSNVRPKHYANSTENQDVGNTSSDNTSEGELSNRQSRKTSNNGDVIQNKRHVKQQTADEDYNIQHPSPRNTSGEGENLTNVSRANRKCMTQNGTVSKRRQPENQMTPGSQVIWKQTGPQQIVSGCALFSAKNSPLLKRQESVKNVAMAKQPAAYMRSANRLVGDFAGRPISAPNKKPVWK